jgi:hypothetical protein
MTSAELTALLDRLEGLEQTATPGEWEPYFVTGDNTGFHYLAYGNDLDDGKAPAAPLCLRAGDVSADEYTLYIEPNIAFTRRDAALIAESRNALPVLIRELRARLG